MANYNPTHLVHKFLNQNWMDFKEFLAGQLDLDPLYDREALEEAAEEIRESI